MVSLTRLKSIEKLLQGKCGNGMIREERKEPVVNRAIERRNFLPLGCCDLIKSLLLSGSQFPCLKNQRVGPVCDLKIEKGVGRRLGKAGRCG